MKTNTKQLVTNALLLAVGFLLHYLTPAIGLPMQIDFSLVSTKLCMSQSINYLIVDSIRDKWRLIKCYSEN